MADDDEWSAWTPTPTGLIRTRSLYGQPLDETQHLTPPAAVAIALQTVELLAVALDELGVTLDAAGALDWTIRQHATDQPPPTRNPLAP